MISPPFIFTPPNTTIVRFGKRGLVPDTGAGTWLLPKLIGYHQALRLLYTAEFHSAQQLKEIGFAHEVVPHENLMAAARRAAEEKARSEQQAEAEMRARRAAATLFQADRRAAQARKARRAPDPDRALWEECSYDKADPEKISRLLNCGADPNMKYGVSQIHKNTLHQFH